MNDPDRSPARIGVIGIGRFGKLHARTLAGLAEAQLAGVVDSSAAAIEQLQSELPAASSKLPAWPDLETALRESDAEAWIIATHTPLHVPLAEKILSAGKKVLIEKPLSTDLETARRLSPLVRPDSSNVMMGHICLFAPGFRKLVREAHARGRIQYFSAVRHRPDWALTAYPDNPIRLTMVHDLYLTLVMMGGGDPDRLEAHMRRADGQGAEGEDRYNLATAHLQWPGGKWVSLTASFLTPPGMPADGYDRMEVFGPGWAAQLRLNPQALELWDQKAHWPMGLDIDDDPAGPSGWLAEELRQFCRVVRGTSAVPVGARYEDALKIQDWMQRLEESAREKR